MKPTKLSDAELVAEIIRCYIPIEDPIEDYPRLVEFLKRFTARNDTITRVTKFREHVQSDMSLPAWIIERLDEALAPPTQPEANNGKRAKLNKVLKLLEELYG